MSEKNLKSLRFHGLDDIYKIPSTAEDIGAAAPSDVTNAKTTAINESKAYTNEQVKKAAPRNLLDNSDFTNPVNQRGITNLTPGTTKTYFVDRWCSGRTVVSVSNDGVHFAWDGKNGSDGYIQQIIPTKMTGGEKLTLAFKVAGNVNPYVKVFTLATTQAGATLDTGIGASIQLYNGTIYLAIATSRTEGITVEWIAFYEGEYTIDTLPEYQPKGYGAELAECQRYYISSEMYYVPVSILTTTKAYGQVDLPVTMHKTPVIKLDSVGKLYTSSGAITSVTSLAVNQGNSRGFIIAVTGEGFTTGPAMLYDAKFALLADYQ